MALSARNKLNGRVEAVKLGDILANVFVRVGDSFVESVITRTSVEELNLKVGDSVKVVVKSTEVMIEKDRHDPTDPDSDFSLMPSRWTRAMPPE